VLREEQLQIIQVLEARSQWEMREPAAGDEQKRLLALQTAKRIALTARKAAKWFVGAQGAADELVGEGFSEAARESHVLAEAYDLWVQVLRPKPSTLNFKCKPYHQNPNVCVCVCVCVCVQVLCLNKEARRMAAEMKEADVEESGNGAGASRAETVSSARVDGLVCEVRSIAAMLTRALSAPRPQPGPQHLEDVEGGGGGRGRKGGGGGGGGGEGVRGKRGLGEAGEEPLTRGSSVGVEKKKSSDMRLAMALIGIAQHRSLNRQLMRTSFTTAFGQQQKLFRRVFSEPLPNNATRHGGGGWMGEEEEKERIKVCENGAEGRGGGEGGDRGGA
jgi:hypothetical protein